MQVKKIIAVLLTVCLLFSLSVPAYAVDEVYSISNDTAPAPVIFYTADYYPGAVSEMRSAGFFANRIAHGSYGTLNYNPSWFYVANNDYPSGDFNSLTPIVTADQTDVSGIYSIPNTSFMNGQALTFRLPNTDDCCFDFQSSNFLFDQQSPNANTFYINGNLTFSIRNLWTFTGVSSGTNTKNDSFYLASDPLAVQLLIDGKPYGDILDVTGYTSPFTALYNGGVPANATVSFNNLKVYYQGDTPDMVGFRIFTGSSFADGTYSYGNFVAVGVENSITLRCVDVPDITFVQEGGDGYAGDLSGISGLLSTISSSISSLLNLLTGSSVYFLGENGALDGTGAQKSLFTVVRIGFLGLRSILGLTDAYSLGSNGNLNSVGGYKSIARLVADGFLALRTYLSVNGVYILSHDGTLDGSGQQFGLSTLINFGFRGLRTIMLQGQQYFSDTVFPWQSYNMQTHQLNAVSNITGQNNLFFTAFQSMEDKLGRLAYVFGSDEDLALKDSADPGTDAFRENFGGGLSIGQIKDGADVITGVNGLFDSGYSFGDAFTEISGNAGFFAWFTPENAAALDSTGSVMVLDDSDPYNMQIYYDHFQTVKEKREAGDD